MSNEAKVLWLINYYDNAMWDERNSVFAVRERLLVACKALKDKKL